MRNHSLYPRLWLLVCLVVLVSLGAACQPAAQTTLPTSAPLQQSTPIPTATPTALVLSTFTPSPEAVASQSPGLPIFEGERALADVEYQVSLGPRTPGSQAHEQVIEWISDQLSQNDWQVEHQETTYAGQPVHNIIAKRSPTDENARPWILLGAHYDSRLLASADPVIENRQTPVPGANDGASGVAVLVELARILPEDLQKQVWLVFFDSEDQGDIPGWDWIYGSRAFVEQMEGDPDAMILLDMVGDAHLDLYYERTSNQQLAQEIWALAKELGYGEQFIPTPKYSVLDDHTPFLERGIRAVDLIDFDYAYWHTLEDTPDKLSAESLSAVGDTLLNWLVFAQ